MPQRKSDRELIYAEFLPEPQPGSLEEGCISTILIFIIVFWLLGYLNC